MRNQRTTSDYSANKSLGQHFLSDPRVTQKIIHTFYESTHDKILEIGPGKGVLTADLFQRSGRSVVVCDIDSRSVALLRELYPDFVSQIILSDILKLDFNQHFQNHQFSVIGNFPYNISTEIVFKLLGERKSVPYILGMFQKEVAKRFAAKHDNKEYGITTVLLQAYYDVVYLFDVPPGCFNPPPKVMSGVLEIKRKSLEPLILNESLFVRMVKAGFNMRRKTLRNALASLTLPLNESHKQLLSMRAEQLSVSDWINFANEMCRP